MQTVRQNQNNMEIDLLRLIRVFWKHKFKIVLAAILGAAIGLSICTLLVTPKYTAGVYLYANNYSQSSEQSTTISSGDLSASAQLVDTYAAIICRDAVLDRVVEEEKLLMSSSELANAISISAVNGTEVFLVAVEHADAVKAAAIANTIADIAPERIAQIVEGCSVEVVDRAKVPTMPSSPSRRRYAAAGGAIGLLAAMLVIFLLDLADTTVQSETDLEGWDLPILGSIPDFSHAFSGSKYGYGYGKRRKSDEKKQKK